MATPARKIRSHAKTTRVFQEHEKLFRALIENSAEALELVSGDVFFIFVSPAIQKMLGYTPEELVGRNIREFFPVQEISEVIAQFQAIVENPALTITVQHPYLHKNGSIR